MDLLERDEHVSLLLDAVSAAVAGGGSVALVTGEAGIGKSSLVDAFVDVMPNSRIRVWRGACDDLLTPPSLGPVREAVAGVGGPLEQALACDRLDQVISALGAEFREQPTALIVEDIHWADDATLDLLTYLARRIARYPALIVLTFRDEEVDSRHRLRPLLSALAAVPTLRLALEPLTQSAIATLAAGTDWDAAALHRLTGGNPFYVVQALEGPHGVPASVVDAVLARVRALDPSTVAAIEQLSVIPTGIDLASAYSLVDGESTLAAAEARGILVVRDQQIGFRHEIARRAIAQSMTSVQRRTMNQRVLRSLLTLPNPPLSSVVHHAMEAGDADVLVRYAPRLARAATNAGAHRQAMTSFEAVLPHADRLPLAERAALYEGYAFELQIASRFTDAVLVGREAVELRRLSGDATQLAEGQARQARHHLMAGDIGAARRLSEEAVRTAQAVRSTALQATTTTFRGATMIHAGEVVQGFPLLQKALELAEASQRLKLVPLCLGYSGVARCIMGDAEGLADVRAAIASAESLSEPGTFAICQYMMVDLLYRLHKWEELEELVDASIQWTNAQGHWSVMHSLEVHRAILDLRHGAWLTAEQRLRELIDSIDEPGLLVSHAYPVLGRLLARRGSPDAFQIIDTAWRRAVTGKAILTVVDAGVAYVEWAWLNDRPDLAIVVRDTILRDFPAAAGPLFGELRRYLDRAGAPLDPEVPGRSPLFEPIADGLDGDWKSAAEGWQRAGDEYEAALELASSGTIGPMTEAVAILEKLGADRVAAQFRRELRSRGVHIPSRPSPQKSSTANPAGLSDRQLEVLLLLAEGLPNREIADRLVVSVRTVDHHVAAILSKLGAMNRREAATIARSWRLSANITEDPTHTANRP